MTLHTTDITNRISLHTLKEVGFDRIEYLIRSTIKLMAEESFEQGHDEEGEQLLRFLEEESNVDQLIDDLEEMM